MKNFCNENDIGYASSVWDIKSAHEIVAETLNDKIPLQQTYFPIHNYLCENYMGDIHLSTGMTTRSEINEIIEFYKSKSRIDDQCFILVRRDTLLTLKMFVCERLQTWSNTEGTGAK